LLNPAVLYIFEVPQTGRAKVIGLSKNAPPDDQQSGERISMIQHQIRLQSDVTTALAYELNSVALTVAAEAERLVHRDNHGIVDGGVELAAQIHCLIDQLQEAARAMRYARHHGRMPPQPAPLT
jgi:hypothetical protein